MSFIRGYVALLWRACAARRASAVFAQAYRRVAAQELVQFFAMYMELKNSKSASERLQIAQKLIADFLLTNSPNEINLEHASRMSMERLRARLARGLDADFDLHLFDRVRDEVRTMVANNLMPVYATRQSN